MEEEKVEAKEINALTISHGSIGILHVEELFSVRRHNCPTRRVGVAGGVGAGVNAEASPTEGAVRCRTSLSVPWDDKALFPPRGIPIRPNIM